MANINAGDIINLIVSQIFLIDVEANLDGWAISHWVG